MDIPLGINGLSHKIHLFLYHAFAQACLKLLWSCVQCKTDCHESCADPGPDL